VFLISNLDKAACQFLEWQYFNKSYTYKLFPSHMANGANVTVATHFPPLPHSNIAEGNEGVNIVCHRLRHDIHAELATLKPLHLFEYLLADV
jgi:hypothetical protein